MFDPCSSGGAKCRSVTKPPPQTSSVPRLSKCRLGELASSHSDWTVGCTRCTLFQPSANFRWDFNCFDHLWSLWCLWISFDPLSPFCLCLLKATTIDAWRTRTKWHAYLEYCALSVPLCLVLQCVAPFQDVSAFWLEARPHPRRHRLFSSILIYSRRHCVRFLSWRLPEKSRQIILLTRPTLHQHWFRHQVFYSLSHTSSTLVGLCPTSRKKKRCPQAFLSLRAHMGKPWTATAKLSPLLKHIETICHRCLSLFHHWFTIAQGFAKSL